MTFKKPEFVGDEKGGGRTPLRLPLGGLPWKLKGMAFVVVVFVVVVGALYSMFLEYVRPNEFGIKEVQIGATRGIQEKVYEPGLAFVMPFGFQKIHRLPRHVQVLELTQVSPNTAKTGAQLSSSVYYEHPAKIQTSDGFYVDVDVTILYRISDPYLVVTKLGPGMQYLHQGILPKAEPILKQALGELTTEEFYNSPLRVEKANLAQELLNKEMEAKGIHVDHVMVRYFKYSEAIQQNIEDKKLQDQLVFTNQSKRKAAMEEQNLNRVRMEGQMQVKVTLEEGDAYKVRKDAEKELYVRRKQAEADLLVQLAEAQKTELKNTAMQALGADRMVALEMAQVLKGLETILLPTGGEGSVNPLRLDDLWHIFGGAMVEEGEEIPPLRPQVTPTSSRILEERAPSGSSLTPEAVVENGGDVVEPEFVQEEVQQ